jgi:mRNA-degrading endonuclease RelE of RelBE toxin-antitoxin system
MRLRYSKHFLKQYAQAPGPVRKAFDKQSGFLTQNLQHPSLHAKKYDQRCDVWQARVNSDWRFYFSIEEDEYLLHEIKPHPK